MGFFFPRFFSSSLLQLPALPISTTQCLATHRHAYSRGRGAQAAGAARGAGERRQRHHRQPPAQGAGARRRLADGVPGPRQVCASSCVWGCGRPAGWRGVAGSPAQPSRPEWSHERSHSSASILYPPPTPNPGSHSCIGAGLAGWGRPVLPWRLPWGAVMLRPPCRVAGGRAACMHEGSAGPGCGAAGMACCPPRPGGWPVTAGCGAAGMMPPLPLPGGVGPSVQDGGPVSA